MKNLSEHEAYAAMFAFLEGRYRLTKSDDLGALLGSMSLLPGGGTADPAIWDDWLNVIKEAEAGSVRVDMELK
ncbi:MAG: hypothetical protein IPJ33_04565 [Gammaproteobacteria bacterium]|nr:hypothetical protein [Gammaproteobacteria bacterium]